MRRSLSQLPATPAQLGLTAVAQKMPANDGVQTLFFQWWFHGIANLEAGRQATSISLHADLGKHGC